jgi:RNA:NAD 2'-phosphotransferase (TPT1/KptA family)
MSTSHTANPLSSVLRRTPKAISKHIDEKGYTQRSATSSERSKQKA